MFKVVAWGIVTAATVSVEVMCNKWLQAKRGVNGDITGMFVMLIEGIIGTICLIITTAAGSGLYELSWAGFGMMILAGVFCFLAIVIANFSIAIGLAGVSLSIINCTAALQVVVSSLLLNQVITTG